MSNATEEFHLSLPYAVFLTVLNILSSVVGTIGNTLVLMVIMKSRTLNGATDYFIMSLAAADFLVTSTMQPMFLYHINFYTETDGTIFDVILDITGYVSNLASIASMLVVTFDRLVAIRFPLKYKHILSRKKVVIVIITVWFCSTLFGIFFRLYSLHAGLMWGISSLLLLGTLSSYPYIFYVAHKQEKLSKHVIIQIVTSSTNPSENSSPERRKRFRIFAEKKSAKTVAIVVGAFALSWLPILVYTQIKMKDFSNKNDFLPGFFIVYTMSLCNSACNPFIYCVRNQRYRTMLKKILGRRKPSVATKTTGLDNHGVSKS